MAKRIRALAFILILIVVGAGAIGVLNTAGVVVSSVLLVFGYVVYSTAKGGSMESSFDFSSDNNDSDFSSQLSSASTNKEIFDLIQEREREIFNNDIYLNAQNTIIDTLEVDRGENENVKIRACLVQDKTTNQDMLFHIDMNSGEIVRRSQVLENLEYYNLFENLQYAESLKDHKYSSGQSEAIDMLKKILRDKGSKGSKGLPVDKDEEQKDDGIIDVDYTEVD